MKKRTAASSETVLFVFFELINFYFMYEKFALNLYKSEFFRFFADFQKIIERVLFFSGVAQKRRRVECSDK